MGCWNKTCAVSNLHITAGTDVVVFILARQAKQYSYCYNNTYYQPVLLPFYAKYDDYGGAENCTGLGLNILIEAVRSDLVEMEQGKNPYHDPPAKKDTFNIDQLLNLDHEGRLFIGPGQTDPKMGTALTHVQIHRTIFDHILENYRLENWFTDEKGKFRNVEYGFADIVATLPEWIARLRERMKRDGVLEGEHRETLRWLRRESLHSLFKYEEGNLASKWLKFYDMESGSSRTLIDLRGLVFDYAETHSDEELTELLIEILKGQFINAFMSATRKAWIKPIGEGSQQQDQHPYKVLIKGMQKAFKEENEKYR